MPETPRTDTGLGLRGRRELTRESGDRVNGQTREAREHKSHDRRTPAGPSSSRRARDPESSSTRYFDRAPSSSTNAPVREKELPRGPAALVTPRDSKRPAEQTLPSGPMKSTKTEPESTVRYNPQTESRSFRPSRPVGDRDDRTRDRRDEDRDRRDRRGGRDPWDHRDPRDSRDSRDSRKFRDIRDSRERRETSDFRDRRDFRDSRDSRGFRDREHTVRDIRNPQDRPVSRDDRPPRGPDRLLKGSRFTRKISLHTVKRDTSVYERVMQVGEGTYGKVYKAKNLITGSYVALKRLRMETEKEGFPITAMRETRLLQSLQHQHIVSLYEIMVENKAVHMVFEYADHDLTGLLANPEVKFTPGNCKELFRQLLDGIAYLHARRIIHRDIKGSNLLITGGGILKVADFGLARKMKTVDSRDYTNRVITLWYRPPELLLGTTDYGREVDMWGIGCLLVELFTASALFQAQDEISQLNVIFQMMGTPTVEQWPQMTELPWYELVKPKTFNPPQFQAKYRSTLSRACLDLAEKLLAYDPQKRLTAKESLRHHYFQELPRPEPLRREALVGEWHEFEAKKKRRKEREDRKREEMERKSLGEEKSVEPLSGDEKAREISSDNGYVKNVGSGAIETTDGGISVVETSIFIEKEKTDPGDAVGRDIKTGARDPDEVVSGDGVKAREDEVNVEGGVNTTNAVQDERQFGEEEDDEYMNDDGESPPSFGDTP